MNAQSRFDAWQFDLQKSPRAMPMKAVRQTNQANVPLRSTATDATPGPIIPIEVRAARWRDLLSLHAIDQRYSLDFPHGLCTESNPAIVGLRHLMPLTRHDQPLFVARADRRLVGFAQFEVIGPDQRWMLQGVGSNMGIYEAEPIWEELFHFAVVSAGLDGTKRLYARIPVGAPVVGPARRVGFSSYVTESIWAASLVPVTRGNRRVRRQHQSDVWSIHQLYLASVPRQIQYAEALTSHSWDVTTQQLAGSATCQGWLVEDGHMISAYARVVSHSTAHSIEVLVDPEHRETFPDLLATVFAELGRKPARRVYLALRGYQSELADILQGFGLVLQLEQDVYIKHTTVSSWSPIINLSPFAADVKEPSAKRVPTFMHGSPSDSSSETAGSQ